MNEEQEKELAAIAHNIFDNSVFFSIAVKNSKQARLERAENKKQSYEDRIKEMEHILELAQEYCKNTDDLHMFLQEQQNEYISITGKKEDK